MHNAAHRMFLAVAMGLTAIFVNVSGATAASSPCKTPIDDNDGAISKAMKLASAIRYGVSDLVTGGSGDHPGHLFIVGLEQFQKAAYQFVQANQLYVIKPNPSAPDPSTFDPTTSDCPKKPVGSKGKDGCNYCPTYDVTVNNGNCPDKYYKGLNSDAYALAFGPGPAPPMLAEGLGQIAATESIGCIASYLRSTEPNSEREIAASNLVLATYSVLGSTDGPDTPANRYMLGIPPL